MNSVAIEPRQWLARKWAYSILAVFALQVGLVWFFSEPPPRPAPLLSERTAIHLAADPWSIKQIQDWPGLEDPTLFALPNHQNFSGSAWLTFTPMEYEQKDWTEPPQLLELKAVRLGEAFGQMVSSNVPAPTHVVDKPMPRSVIPDFAVLNSLAPTQSECRIEGDLASRPLLEPLALPSWTHTDFLTNSIVQLLVNADGFPFSTRMLGTCGLPEADQYAFNLARQARFQPLPRPESGAETDLRFTWGKMIFQWYCSPPPVTASNLPSVSP